MIDITVGNNEVSIDNRLYHSFNDRHALELMISDIINSILYSGETIELYTLTSADNKKFIAQWFSENKTR